MTRRASAAALAGLLLVALPAGCVVRRPTAKRLASVQHPERERITGVLLSTGDTVRFNASGAVVLRDTIFGMSGDRLREIPLAEAQRLWVVRVDIPRTVGKTVLRTVGTTVGAVAALIAIAAPTSCPYVYSWDGRQWVLDAEPYGGAVTKGLERDDWAELEHLRPHGGEYRLLMTNEAEETQHTNLAELLVVHHREGTQAVIDQSGVAYALGTPRQAARASDGADQDLRPTLSAADGRAWAPEPSPGADGSMRDEIILAFPRPAAAQRGVLLARASTSHSGAASMRWMLDLRGSAVTQWYAAVDRYPQVRSLLEAWNLREELFVLKVEVEEPSGWTVRGVIGGGGPVAPETRAVPLDLSGVRGDSLRVRLRPPRGFWFLDAISVAYDAGAPVRVDTLRPLEATDRKRGPVAAALGTTDSSYYEMPVVGDSATLRFAAPAPLAGTRQTVFLHTRGFYRLHLPADRAPDAATLQTITEEPDAAARLYARRFADWKAGRVAAP
jgi:hypothetical protein